MHHRRSRLWLAAVLSLVGCGDDGTPGGETSGSTSTSGSTAAVDPDPDTASGSTTGSSSGTVDPGSTGSSGGGGSSSGGLTGGTTTGGLVPDCATYCAEMAEVCPMEGFHHEASCMAWCEHDVAPAPLGTADDTDVDTIGCRLGWIGTAARAEDPGERAAACANASASGGDTCGSWCDVYCRQGVEICTDGNPDYPPMGAVHFDDDPAASATEECMAACAGFGTDVLDGVSQVDQHFGYGETVQCRLHHQQAAMIEGPEQASAYNLHCGHAAPEPTELCTDTTPPNAINYCEFAIGFCPDLFEPGATTTDCRQAIQALIGDGVYVEAGFPSFTDTDVNSVGCLNYWIMRAPHQPMACAFADYDPASWNTMGGQGRCVPPEPPSISPGGPSGLGLVAGPPR